MKKNVIGIRILLMAFVIALWGFSGVQAEDDSLREDLQKTLQEIEELRSELAALKEDSAWQYKKDLTEALVEMPTAAAAGSGSLVLPEGWSIQPYGYIKFDMSYDDSAVNGANGDYIVSVKPENETTRADDKFSFTARQTRLGAKIFAPNIGDAKVMGRFELDFYNPVTTATNEYKSTPQMRHAYGQVSGADWSFLFGQTSDIISPLFPSTINYTVGWFGGNPGYRHPQLRLTKSFECPDDHKLQLQAALSRDINSDKDGGLVDDGQDASSPTVLGRVSYSMPMAGKRCEAGVSGHFGREEIDWAGAGDDIEVNTWSVNGDLVVPICDALEFKGEVFWAENFDSYFGGVGQGVNSVSQDEIETIGGWAQLAYKPCSEWAFNGGAGMDDPVNCDLNDGDKSKNIFAFINANYFFSKYLRTGVEVSYWSTDYKNSDDGDNFRVQHSWWLFF